MMIGEHPLIVVVGSGGVGKTTLAASLGLYSARRGLDTLVMTFDPSLRLKDALGVGEEAREREMPVPLGPNESGQAPGRLDASLLDARRTFDQLIERYAPDDEARQRILDNRFYQHLSGSLAGILEYMAVERLFEVAEEGRYRQVILDTPPTRQALDFLEAPQRIVDFLDSSALRVALREWFDDGGKLKATSRLGGLGRKVEGYLDRVIGIDFLREVSEFFRAFGPLYDGFRRRAQQVQELLRAPTTRFLLVSGPGQERIPDTLFFARKLEEAGLHLGAVAVNRVHPRFAPVGEERAVAGAASDGAAAESDGRRILRWLGDRDHAGLEELQRLLGEQTLVEVPMMAEEPTDLGSLETLGTAVAPKLASRGLAMGE
ncbi:MAG: ArsA-related P-loop ATPase [Acidobacteriota bacterium]|nr:ArsA-related P-loop ATPase [Acidobacteriota bacterium]